MYIGKITRRDLSSLAVRRNFPPGCQDIPEKTRKSRHCFFNVLPLTQLSWPTMLNRHWPVLTSQTLERSRNKHFMGSIPPSQICPLNQRRGRAQCRWSCDIISKQVCKEVIRGGESSEIYLFLLSPPAAWLAASLIACGMCVNNQDQSQWTIITSATWFHVTRNVLGHLRCSLWSPGNTFYNVVVVSQLCLAILATSLMQNQVTIWFLGVLNWETGKIIVPQKTNWSYLVSVTVMPHEKSHKQR